MFGLGKKRSEFGKYLDREGLQQNEVAAASDLSEETVSRLCVPGDRMPTKKTCTKLNKGLKKLGKNVDVTRFWR